MKQKNIVPLCFLVLTLLLCTVSQAQAVPLSLGPNIELIVRRYANSGDSFDFAVTGDSRDGAETLGRIMDRARTFKPLFILHTGDAVTRGEPSEYDQYTRQLVASDIPILHVPGNHDVRGGPETYRRYVGELNWYFDLGTYRIVGLDNASGKFSQSTVAFARGALSGQKNCFITFHTPPPFERWSGHGMHRSGSWEDIMGLIQQAKPSAVFLGHIHAYDETEVAGTKYIVSGGGGAELHRQYHSGKSEHGFLLVRVRPNAVTHEWIALESNPGQ